MAALKTNYKDDVFSGRRKYTQIDNGDGTVSFDDVTSYSQVGDVFSAADANAITTAINGITTTSALIVSSSTIPVADRDGGKMYFFYNS